jgi:hypothetical protein
MVEADRFVLPRAGVQVPAGLVVEGPALNLLRRLRRHRPAEAEPVVRINAAHDGPDTGDHIPDEPGLDRVDLSVARGQGPNEPAALVPTTLPSTTSVVM